MINNSKEREALAQPDFGDLELRRIVKIERNQVIFSRFLEFEIRSDRRGNPFMKFNFLRRVHANLFPGEVEGMDFNKFMDIAEEMPPERLKDFLNKTVRQFRIIPSKQDKYPDSIEIIFDKSKVKDYLDFVDGKANESQFEADTEIYVDGNLNNIYIDEKLAEICAGEFGYTSYIDYQLQVRIIDCFDKLDQSHLRNYLEQVLVDYHRNNSEERNELIIHHLDNQFAEQLLEKYEAFAVSQKEERDEVLG